MEEEYESDNSLNSSLSISFGGSGSDDDDKGRKRQRDHDDDYREEQDDDDDTNDDTDVKDEENEVVIDSEKGIDGGESAMLLEDAKTMSLLTTNLRKFLEWRDGMTPGQFILQHKQDKHKLVQQYISFRQAKNDHTIQIDSARTAHANYFTKISESRSYFLILMRLLILDAFFDIIIPKPQLSSCRVAFVVGRPLCALFYILSRLLNNT